jgi:hypothetical protein
MTIEPSTSKPTMEIFPAGAVLTTMVLIATAGNSPTLTIDFKLGCSVMTWAIGGLTL